MISIIRNTEIIISGEHLLVLRNICEIAKQQIDKLPHDDDEMKKESKALILEVFDAAGG